MKKSIYCQHPLKNCYYCWYYTRVNAHKINNTITKALRVSLSSHMHIQLEILNTIMVSKENIHCNDNLLVQNSKNYQSKWDDQFYPLLISPYLPSMLLTSANSYFLLSEPPVQQSQAKCQYLRVKLESLLQ